MTTLRREEPSRGTSQLDLAELAPRVAPWTGRTTAIDVDISDGRRGRIVVATQTINGRRIMVQKRHAFAVHVREQPVKKQ